MPLDQLTTKPEATLDGLASDRKLAKLRAIDDAGASITATPEQIAAALADPLAPLIAPKLGTDYSLLTEQIVPGEYFLDKNGAKKAVYARTFRFSSLCYLLSSENRGAWGVSYSIPGISGILSVTGTVIRGNGEIMALIPFKDFLFYAEITIANSVNLGGRGLLAEVGKNMVCNVVLKYTK